MGAEDLSRDDVVPLLAARGDALAALMGRAAALRDEGLARAGRPGVVTYSPKVFVPVTTLCRDRCRYCTFVDTPARLRAQGREAYLAPEQVLAIAHQGRAAGCAEALFTLGDRPEERWPAARAWLDRAGFASTVEYLAHLARLVTERTGLLVHHNPGVLTPAELALLRPTAPSMGMMLETTSRAVFDDPHGAHFGSPDKDPAVRLRVLADAGAARVPFTTGILVGIGESLADRADSLLALRDVHARHGHLQEVIVQNFRAKPATAMQGADDAGREEYLAAIAAARVVLGPDVRVQAPPNLSDPTGLADLLAAGIDDWGGISPVTADHVNPERPWPALDDLAAVTRAAGLTLRPRLTVHDPYVRDRATWVDPGLHAALDAARARLDAGGAVPTPGPLASPASPAALAPTGTSTGTRPEASHPARPTASGKVTGAASGAADVRGLLARAAADPDALTDADHAALLALRGPDLDALAAVADDLRRSTVGDTVGLVVNRNLGSDRCTDPALAGAVAADAAALGCTEVCVQGTAGRDADPHVYERLAAAITAAAPGVHLHAFRPADVVDGARRTGRDLPEHLSALRAAGVATVPGTGVKLLDEAYRAARFPDDLPVEEWVASITTAHRLGLRSTSVVFVGHGETPAQRVAHLRRLQAIQRATGGFTELVVMTVPGAPVDLADVRATHAVARLLLHADVRHQQAAWTRLGVDGALAVLRAGADDLGGTLLDGRVAPDLGVEHGRELPVARAAAAVRSIGRTLRLRTTTYGVPGQA